MDSSQNRCPLCGSETQSSVINDAQAIRQQIQRLQEQLRQVEGEEGEHPHTMTGGYGADPTEA